MADDTCEVKSGDGWQLASVEDVVGMASDVPKRCPECHGAVRAHKASNNGMRAHFEHLAGHKGCSRGASFSGTRSLHPDALQ